MSIIGVSDPDNFTFSRQLFDHWAKQGHEIRTSLYHEESFTEECDVVFYDFCSQAVGELKRFGKKPKRVIIRAMDIEIYDFDFEHMNWDLVDYLVFVSEHTKRMALEDRHNTCPESKIRVVSNGVNMDQWTLKKSNTGKKALFCGRLWIGKNPAGALDVVHELNKKDPGWSLTFRAENCDPPWYNKYFQHRCKTENFPIDFVGRVDDLNTFYDNYDLLILPSFKEAFSYVTAECLAKGIPCLVNDWYDAHGVWPSSYIYRTPSEAVEKYEKIKNWKTEFHRANAEKYDENYMFEAFDKMLEGKL